MIRNYLKTALRNLRKNKAFTLINILGLALGLATCLLIMFYVVDELSYDRYNSNANRIFRINTDIKFGGTTSALAITPPPLASALLNNFPEVEKACRLYHDYGVRIKKDNKSVQEEKVVYSDPGLFQVFTLPLIAGNAKTALSEPNTMVITRSTALRYFNHTQVVGQTLMVNDQTPYKITGVIQDIPEQSHFHFDFFLSLASRPENKSTNWLNYSCNTYVLLKPNTDYLALNSKLYAFIQKVILEKDANMDLDNLNKTGNYIKMNLIPLTSIHLQSNRQYELGVNSSMQYIYIFSAIALFVLLIACINFMNLATARSANRAREVGVRKVLGSSRSSLVVQFMAESVIVTLVATLLAAGTAWLMLPLFNQVSGKSLAVSWHVVAVLIPVLLFVVLLVGSLAGAYPAFFLSAFQPVQVLKGKLATGFKNSGFRSFLVVFQFAISIFLIIGTLVIYHQLQYIQNKNLGFNRSQVLVVKNVQILNQQAKTFKQEVKQLTGVENATLSGYIPTGSNRNPDEIFTTQVATPKSATITEIWPVDADYIPTMKMSMLQGRNFSKSLLTDSSGVIINEAAARRIGDRINALDKKLYYFSPVHNKEFRVIGIVKDFNFASLRDNVSPVIMALGDDYGALSVRLNTTNVQELVAKIEQQWKALSPNQHFDYSFMDADFDALYRSEQRMGKLFLAFTMLAIGIACLGLFGLAAYAAEQRIKEISIRKVLGADVSAIVLLLSRDFIKLVIIAILIAAPLAWLAMHQWLQGFAYRQHMSWWIFLLAGTGALLIAFGTVSSQSIKAAVANPVKSLRSE
ncbi:FtsX-like permease family protein [Mucilaginibacter robiniae]|uniref:FtsX-like permease family protein n=1 Tax=Mucilaginibacter robiniae TaxID=2728022 RepID=A0A7L5E2L0_9SPHI|nr:ABC transporter permease [Mucilaginibacter robiniae]QJD95033.1 FtsX-like permease family protein [Mucilaginibacter robiniae]